jgi:hypothetical protein
MLRCQLVFYVLLSKYCRLELFYGPAAGAKDIARALRFVEEAYSSN